MTPAGFFAALRADPSDNTTRLIFADWLDDHDDPDRAAFIRLAVRLERLPEDHPNRAALLARYNDQRLTNGPRWLGPQPDTLEDVGYRGGLIERAVFRADAPAADVEGFIDRHPIRELSIDGKRSLRELARSPALEQIRSLIVRSGSLKRQAHLLDRLLSSPHLHHLDELSLKGDAVDNYLARVLTDAPALRGLVVLRLEQTRLSDAGIMQLLWPEALPGLREWHVDCPQATWTSMQNLFAPSHANRWRALTWPALRSWRGVHLDGLQECRELRRLDVRLPVRYGWDQPRLDWLDGPPHLQRLSLSGFRGTAGLAELAYWPGLARLEWLGLRSPGLGPAGFQLIQGWLRNAPYGNLRTRIEILG
jgi:uncharacterized protein (TIGR02996 family)